MENPGTKLPNDPSYWDEIILNELEKKSPLFAATITAIDVKESDYPNGDLTGIIVASGGKVLIPLVVRGFRLKPMDVLICGDKVMSMSERTVNSAVFSPSSFGGKLTDRKDLQTSTDISQLISPPVSGSSGFTTPSNYSNKMAGAGMSLLGALKIAGDAAKDRLATGLTCDRILLTKVAELLPFKDILAEIVKTTQEKSASRTIGQDGNVIHLHYKPNGDLDSGSDSLYIRTDGNTYSVNGVTKVAFDTSGLSEDMKTSLLLTGEALHAPEDSRVDITILTKKGMTPLKNTTLADVVCREGDSLEGVFLANVISFSGHPSYKGLFLSQDKQWIYQEHLIGSALRNPTEADEGRNFMNEFLYEVVVAAEDTPKIGEYGTFILGQKAIEPFKVVSLYNVAGAVIMSVAALSGQRLVVEYREGGAEDPRGQQPLMVASGNLVSKYFPTDRVYIVNSPYRYVSLKAQRHGARTPEEALTIPIDRRDGCMVTIKKASGGYLINKDGMFGRQHTSKLLPSKLACQYALTMYGVGRKQAEILTNISPVSFVVEKAAGELQTRHSGAELPETMPQSYPQLLTNNTEHGQFINGGALTTAAMLDDPETLDLLLTVGMGEMDGRVRQYVVSNIGDIHELIDKLGRLLLVVRTSEDTGISESGLSDLVRKLDRTVWELTDFSGRAEEKKESINE